MTKMDPESILALEAIKLERIRQVVEEGYEPSMDDANYPDGEDLCLAAASYCIASFDEVTSETMWPWEGGFHPKSAERDLERAGALIVAELARIYRARKRESGT